MPLSAPSNTDYRVPGLYLNKDQMNTKQSSVTTPEQMSDRIYEQPVTSMTQKKKNNELLANSGGMVDGTVPSDTHSFVHVINGNNQDGYSQPSPDSSRIVGNIYRETEIQAIVDRIASCFPLSEVESGMITRDAS